eukprot:TRINITY_DN19721_c0_g1_i2.p1 TRINITY_DN19721_c0_g1~~TRINITY_DN19721_c0_g1_i2.p1  ORF type:complete len:721 (-),score=196.52 TRINITY_DN19721_c0_g1_i2:149-2311(-)
MTTNGASVEHAVTAGPPKADERVALRSEIEILAPRGYELLRQLGRGQYGTAHLVRRTEEAGADGRASSSYLVAKVVFLEHLKERDRSLALQEVDVLKRLRHPNVVQHFESWLYQSRDASGAASGSDARADGKAASAGGRICAQEVLVNVMEYCAGGDLRAMLEACSKKREQLPEEVVLNLFTQMLQGIRYVHEQNILHRDLKTSNMLLDGTPPRSVKIGDFGIARVLESTAAVAITTLGTPYYMSPEVCKGEPYRDKSDMWSLGCVLYEMCMLRHAFESQSLLGLVYCIVSERYEPVSSDRYSASVGELVARLLAKPADERPSAGEALGAEVVRPYVVSEEAAATAATAAAEAVGRVMMSQPPPPPPVQQQFYPTEENFFPQPPPTPAAVSPSQTAHAQRLGQHADAAEAAAVVSPTAGYGAAADAARREASAAAAAACSRSSPDAFGGSPASAAGGERDARQVEPPPPPEQPPLHGGSHGRDSKDGSLSPPPALRRPVPPPGAVSTSPALSRAPPPAPQGQPGVGGGLAAPLPAWLEASSGLQVVLARIRSALLRRPRARGNWVQAFALHDTTGQGFLGPREFEKFLEFLEVGLSRCELTGVAACLTRRGSCTVSLGGFSDAMSQDKKSVALAIENGSGKEETRDLLEDEAWAAGLVEKVLAAAGDAGDALSTLLPTLSADVAERLLAWLPKLPAGAVDWRAAAEWCHHVAAGRARLKP